MRLFRILAAQAKKFLTAFLLELLWLGYVGFCVLLTTVVRTKRVGPRPPNPCILAVTHVHGMEPPFVMRAVGRWRCWALYTVEWPNVLVRLLFRAFFRFEVTQDPSRKSKVNAETIKLAVRYLKNGGILMVFPEGHRFWERKLYPGVALLAKLAQVPIVPVGVENVPLYDPETSGLPVWRLFLRALKQILHKRWVAVYFTPPIWPNPALSEDEDVDRLMQQIEYDFHCFYHQFYQLPGPVWIKRRRLIIS
jgi:1-acyl-sn-glycerol-3-phosphate acyltransferase